MVCEESGPISLSYNALLTTPKANVIVKLVVFIITIKSTLTCINYGKTSHSMETRHNRKREVLVVLTVLVKSIKHVGGTKTQLVKSRKVQVRYPYIICFNVEHRSKNVPRKLSY
jgi:hypothetical protein